jgi:hypothetical protein
MQLKFAITQVLGNTRRRIPYFEGIVARRYLAIPATSTPSERAFSAAKLYNHRLCSRLGSDKINAMVLLARLYLKKNFPIYFQ